MKVKEAWKKVWHFIWEEDSIWSWLVNVLLAIILVKFIIFPVMGFAMQTNNPVVAVISSSMDHNMLSDGLCGKYEEQHKNNFNNYWEICGEWYESKNISQEQFMNFKFPGGFEKGNIIFLYGIKSENIKIGDIIVFQKDSPVPIIHRVVSKWQESGKWYFATKGDHNSDFNIRINEIKISEDEIVGTAVARIPFLGYIKIWFVNIIDLFRWK